jgi:pantoate kinase
MYISLSSFEEAFINEVITFEQFLEVLIDNFGERETRKIIKKHIKKARKDESKLALKVHSNSVR